MSNVSLESYNFQIYHYQKVMESQILLEKRQNYMTNIKVMKMFDDMKASINTKDEGQIRDYLVRLLDKEAFDRSGLIYGMGHAVYSVSDPRADMLRVFAEDLSVEKGMEEEFALYETVEKLAPQIIAEKRKEFVGEGTRWFDLKRLGGDLDRYSNFGSSVSSTVKEGDYRWLFPIPRSEYRYNEYVNQNPDWPVIAVE